MAYLNLQGEKKAWEQFEREEWHAHQLEGPTMWGNRLVWDADSEVKLMQINHGDSALGCSQFRG